MPHFLIVIERRIWNYYAIEAASQAEAEEKYRNTGEHLGYVESEPEDESIAVTQFEIREELLDAEAVRNLKRK